MVDAGKILITPKGAWNNTIPYEKLDLVTHNGKSWLSRVNDNLVEPSSESLTEWMDYGITVIDSELSETSENAVQNKVVTEAITQLNGTISDAYNNDKTYTVGEYCIYNNQLWKCKVQCQGQTPDENSYWTARKIGDEIKQINVDLSDNHTMMLWKGSVSSGTRCNFSKNLSDIPSWRRLIFMFMNGSENNTVIVEIPRRVYGANTNFGAYNQYDDNRYVQLKMIPLLVWNDSGITPSFVYSSTHQYSLVEILVEY